MSSVSNTAELYRVLEEFGIPVLQEDGSARELHDIVTDMFRAWNRCHSATKSAAMAEALDWLAKHGGDFDEAQELTLQVVLEEQAEKNKKRMQKESDKALDEFLAGFRIIGGDAL